MTYTGEHDTSVSMTFSRDEQETMNGMQLVRNVPPAKPRHPQATYGHIDYCAVAAPVEPQPTLPVLVLSLDHYLGSRSCAERPQLFESLPEVARIAPDEPTLAELARSWQLHLVSSLHKDLQPACQRYLLDSRFGSWFCGVHFTGDLAAQCDLLGSNVLLCDTWSAAVGAQLPHVLLLGDPFEWAELKISGSQRAPTLVGDWGAAAEQLTVCKAAHTKALAEAEHLAIGEAKEGAEEREEAEGGEEAEGSGGPNHQASLIAEIASAASEIWDPVPAALCKDLTLESLEALVEVVRAHFELQEGRIELQQTVSALRAQQAQTQTELRHWKIHGLAPLLSNDTPEAPLPAAKLPAAPEGGVSITEWQHMCDFELLRIRQLKEVQLDTTGRIGRLCVELEVFKASSPAPLCVEDSAGELQVLQELQASCQELATRITEMQKDPSARIRKRRAESLWLEIASASEEMFENIQEQAPELPVALLASTRNSVESSNAVHEPSSHKERIATLQGEQRRLQAKLQLEVQEDIHLRHKLASLEQTAMIVRDWYLLWEKTENLVALQHTCARKENRKRQAVDQWQLRVLQASHTVDELVKIEVPRMTVLLAEEMVQKQQYPAHGVSDQEWLALVRLQECKVVRLREWVDKHPTRLEALELVRAHAERQLQALCKA